MASFGLPLALVAGLFATVDSASSSTMWRGLVVAPENRCAEYDGDDYDYSQNVEDDLVAEYGGVYSPYTGEWFNSDTETDIEHMVARSEAHDSGMCARPDAEKRSFANDLLNLTLSEPRLNRFTKSAKDAAEWLPQYNFCWFAGRVVAVKVKYGLTVDQAEAEALEGVLRSCASTALVIYERGKALPEAMPIPGPASLPATTDPVETPPLNQEKPYPWEGPLTDIWLGPGQAMLLLHAPDGAAIAVPLYFGAGGTPDDWSALTGTIKPDHFGPDGGTMTSDPGLSDGRTAVYGVNVEDAGRLALKMLSCTRVDLVRGDVDCAGPDGAILEFSRFGH